MNHLEKIIAGLTIIAKYGDEYDVAAEHDVIMAGHSVHHKMTPEDQGGMEEAGWHWSESYDSYAFHV